MLNFSKDGQLTALYFVFLLALFGKEDEPNRVARLENVREKNQPKLKTRGGEF